MSNKSLARKNRNRYKLDRQVYRISKEYHLGRYGSKNANGRIYIDPKQLTVTDMRNVETLGTINHPEVISLSSDFTPMFGASGQIVAWSQNQN